MAVPGNTRGDQRINLNSLTPGSRLGLWVKKQGRSGQEEEWGAWRPLLDLVLRSCSCLAPPTLDFLLGCWAGSPACLPAPLLRRGDSGPGSSSVLTGISAALERWWTLPHTPAISVDRSRYPHCSAVAGTTLTGGAVLTTAVVRCTAASGAAAAPHQTTAATTDFSSSATDSRIYCQLPAIHNNTNFLCTHILMMLGYHV